MEMVAEMNIMTGTILMMILAMIVKMVIVTTMMVLMMLVVLVMIFFTAMFYAYTAHIFYGMHSSLAKSLLEFFKL
jgi:hypothetical protein